MNQALTDFIKAWAKEKDAAKLLELDLPLPAETEVKAYLESLTVAEQEHIQHSLTEALTALENHLVTLKLQQADIREQLDNADKISKACLSYTRTPQKSQT